MSGLPVHGFVRMDMNVLVRIGDGGTDGVLGCFASLGQRIVSGIEIFPVLHIAARQRAPETTVYV